ncbi:hypothetical protein AR679_gp067 [Yellowstone lake phycodnavirus 1]|uniref:hypothetical protein n=1 Tax=Yellowstone lake phycodnavirus 1 TaxID=1586713 RepID=UPI0006EB3DA6|nr:hypothetical protein AR679_gp067 [Yellowstone lake phycodnavirus 1]BAT22093.1 hypothetical protein [Yellowstone lake phycodnavirus 1]
MSRVNRQPVQQPEPDEVDMDEDEECDEDDEGGFDMFEALGGLLATDDGETLATIMAGVKSATERIALQLEMQNKILVKILTSMQPVTPKGIVAPA